MVKKIEISHKTIFFILITLVSLAFVYRIFDIILQFFIALLAMAVLNPYVNKMSKYKIPRQLAILLLYLLAFLIVGFSISAIVPPLIEQTTSFINNLPDFIGSLSISAVLNDRIIEQIASQIGEIPSSVARFTISVFSNFLSLVAVFVFSFYLLSERDKLDKQLSYLFGDKKQKEIKKIIDLMEHRLGGWARAQISLMLIVGVFSYIGLRLLGIPYALPLSIIAGILELIPYIGPVLSAIPAVLIGFGLSPFQGLAVAALYFLVQQFENYVFVPKIMQKSAGVNPIVTLLSLAIGFRLAGIVGLLISVPVYISVRLVVVELFFSKD